MYLQDSRFGVVGDAKCLPYEFDYSEREDGFSLSSSPCPSSSDEQQCNNTETSQDEELSSGGNSDLESSSSSRRLALPPKKRRRPKRPFELAVENLRRKRRMEEAPALAANSAQEKGESSSADSDASSVPFCVSPLSRSASVDLFVDDEFLTEEEEERLG